jgi:hypothetical protein
MPITGTERAAATVTPASTRVVSMAAYALALSAWVATIGLPKQTLPAFTWIWLATIAWNVRAPWRSHLAFVRDWWPAAALLTAYLLSRGLADNVGTTVHVAAPAAADRALFGGVLPTAYLQDHLCGQPCDPGSPPRWYDVGLTTVYYSHFFVAITTAAVLWTRNRPEWLRFMRRYLSLSLAALVVFVTIPTAPPWLAADEGVLPAGVSRLTGRGWWELNHAGFHRDLAALGNPVAAMPSVHFAVACFVAWWAIATLRSPWRWSVLAYPLAMGFALVYDAEHYVVDLVGGLLLTTVVMLAWSRWERWRAADGVPDTGARDG